MYHSLIIKQKQRRGANKIEKMYVMDFLNGDHKVFYTLNDVKDAIQLKEKNKRKMK